MEKSSQNQPSFGQGLELAILAAKAIASAVKKTNAGSDKIQKVIGKPGVIFNFFENLLADSVEAKPSILRLISGNKVLVLKALSGRRLICKTEKTFKSFIDNDFVEWGVNKPGIASPKTLVQINEIIGNGTFMDIFKSLPGSWNQKWLSQDQVIEFCEKLPGWLKQDGNATFFLVKKDENKPIDENKPEDNLVVVLVSVRPDGLTVFVYRLEDGGVLRGEDRDRVVSPQLVSSVA